MSTVYSVSTVFTVVKEPSTTLLLYRFQWQEELLSKTQGHHAHYVYGLECLDILKVCMGQSTGGTARSTKPQNLLCMLSTPSTIKNMLCK